MDPYSPQGEPSTLPAPARTPRTDPHELAALERRARRTHTRSRIAEAVALVMTVASAYAAYTREHPAPTRQCVTADEVRAIVGGRP